MPTSKPAFKLITRAALRRIAILFLILSILLTWAWSAMIRMPGKSYRAGLPPLTTSQAETSAALRADVEALASRIGQRSTFYPRQYAQAMLHVTNQLTAAGYTPREHSLALRGTTVPNIDVTLPGASAPNEIVLIGAHVDSFQGTPGADDNASGVAATLALARAFANKPCPRTIRFAFFINEEPPAFQTEDMGSLIYARKCRADGESITAMLSLESLGYYATRPGSQHYPPPLSLFYPSTGDFIAFASDLGASDLVRRAVKTFRETTPFPSEGATLPSGIPGIDWSDHWSFRQTGYQAIMVTGTAPFRNQNYHTPADTPDTLDYDRLSRVVSGLETVIRELATN